MVSLYFFCLVNKKKTLPKEILNTPLTEYSVLVHLSSKAVATRTTVEELHLAGLTQLNGKLKCPSSFF